MANTRQAESEVLLALRELVKQARKLHPLAGRSGVQGVRDAAKLLAAQTGRMMNTSSTAHIATGSLRLRTAYVDVMPRTVSAAPPAN